MQKVYIFETEKQKLVGAQREFRQEVQEQILALKESPVAALVASLIPHCVNGGKDCSTACWVEVHPPAPALDPVLTLVLAVA